MDCALDYRHCIMGRCHDKPANQGAARRRSSLTSSAKRWDARWRLHQRRQDAVPSRHPLCAACVAGGGRGSLSGATLIGRLSHSGRDASGALNKPKKRKQAQGFLRRRRRSSMQRAACGVRRAENASSMFSVDRGRSHQFSRMR